MNDRFKFRVYIPDKKYSKNSLTGMFKVHSLHTGTNKAIISSLYGNVSIKLENNILTQCTGLKDKNGKLIYEGDIVKTETQAGKIINYGIIGFDKEKASFLMTANLQSQDYQYSFWYLDSLEVIGNIYENKELLESEG